MIVIQLTEIEMRIWIVNHYAYAPFHSAGTRHYSLARELIKRGHEVLIISTSFYHKARQETRLQPGEVWKRELIDGVPFLWLRTPEYSGNNLARFWNILVFAGRVWMEVGIDNESKPDLIIGSSPDLFAAFAAERLAKKYDISFIMEIRDVWPQVLIDMGGFARHHPLIMIMERIEKYLYHKAKKIISILPKAIDHIIKQELLPEKIIWLPNGVAIDNVPEFRVCQNSEYFTLIYAGAHSVYSGLDTVLDAAEILEHEGWQHRIRIRLIGDGTEKARLQHSASIRKLQMISFEPPVSKVQIYSVLQEADAFLMLYKNAPVLKWGLCPNKLYDYMISGRPTIFAVGSSNNPVEEAQAGISVKPDAPRALADAIKALYQLPLDERMAMGTRGRDYVKKYHSFENLAQKLEKVLLDVIS